MQGLLLYMAARFRARPGAGEPRQVFGHRNLEIGWTAAPSLILAVVFVLFFDLGPIAMMRSAALATCSHGRLSVRHPNAGGAVQLLVQGLGHNILSGGIDTVRWIGYVMTLAAAR